MTVLDASELVALVRRFYPAEVDAYDSGYELSPERRALAAHKIEAERRLRPNWNGLIRDLLATHDLARVIDVTHLRADNCFTVLLYADRGRVLEPGAVAAAGVLLVSVLAPVHLIYSVLERESEGVRIDPQIAPEAEATAPETRALADLVVRHFGTTALDVEVLATPVPDASTFHVSLGKACLVDLLFADHRR